MWFNSQLKQTSTDLDHLKGNCKGWLIAQIILADMKLSLVKGQEISKGNYGVFILTKTCVSDFFSSCDFFLEYKNPSIVWGQQNFYTIFELCCALYSFFFIFFFHFFNKISICSQSWTKYFSVLLYKDHILWEGHKSLRNLPLTFDYACTVVKNKGKISQNFLAFSEYMNFIRNTAYMRLLNLQNLWGSPERITQCILESCYGNESICLWGPQCFLILHGSCNKVGLYEYIMYNTFTVLDLNIK